MLSAVLKRILYYRGSLSCCNYSCGYCPFALKKNNRSELMRDKQELDNFVDWLTEQKEETSYGVMFTPWGEAMIRRYYQESFIKLSHLPNIHKVCAQTNLSGSLSWLKEVCQETSALWVSFHPGEVLFDDFIKKCEWLFEHHIAFSVGIVGIKESFSVMKKLRNSLPEQVYLWVNAYKEQENYYSKDMIDFITGIDPLFKTNLNDYSSYGQSCETGKQSFLIEGSGEVSRCHFVKERIGNIYKNDLNSMLVASTCPNKMCECYLGYIHLKSLNLKLLYGDSFIERISGRLYN